MTKKKERTKLRKKEKISSKKNVSSNEEKIVKSEKYKHYEEDIGGEDESINDDGSEIGWNSDDEATYGQLFKKKSIEEDDEESNSPEDEDDLEGEGMLLSDMLSNTTSTVPVINHEENTSGNEEDENGAEEDSDNDYAYDDEDDDENNHDQLLAAIEKYSKSDQQPKSALKSNSRLLQFSAESPFSTFQGNQTISLDTLLNSLEQPTGTIDQDTLQHIKSNLISMNSSVSAPKYTNKVHSDRAERGITYQNTTSEMGKWQNIIAENKAQKSLDLRQDKRSVPSTKSMITSYQPQTDMEKEVQMILLKTTKESDVEKNEEDELLHSKELSHEEIREKQRELAKIKSLLFFEQMKRHRINKIKSKTFHRILKKKKLRKQMSSKEYDEAIKKLKDDGDIFEDDLEGDENFNEKETEEEAIRRIKERMSLRHKNTGKWARMALEHGKGSKSLREAYHEAVLLGNELTKKATTINEADDPYQDDLPRRRGDGDEDGRQSKKLKIVDEASESLENILDTGSKDTELNGKYKALFEMDFMKKAREQQQLRAKEEAQQLLREIEQMEDGLSESESEERSDSQQTAENHKSKQEMIQKHKEKLEQARKQMTNLMNGNNSMSLVSSSTSVVESVTTNLVQNNPWLDPTAAAKVRDVHTIIGESGSTKASKSKKRSKNAVTKSEDTATITLHDMDEVEKQVTKKGTTNQTSKSGTPLGVEEKNAKPEPTRKPLLMQKSQQDLVNIAFAGPDYEADFEVLKDKIIDEELNISDKKRKILSDDKAGWGDWAGPGMVGVSQRVVQKRQRLLKNLDEKKAELKAGRKDGALANVILSEKRIKTTAKYKLSDIPHPFTSREEYERSLQMPLGNEWNAEHIVRKNTKPEVMLRAGRIIEPIKLPKQRKSTPA